MTDRAADRAEIAETMYRYARATDWNRPEEHRTVFVEDCVFASPHSGDMHGIDAVLAWMHEVLPQFDHTQHLIGNISIDFTGPDAADYGFTSSLPVQLFVSLAPILRPLFEQFEPIPRAFPAPEAAIPETELEGPAG